MQTADNTLFMGKVAINLHRVDSTNNYAKRLIANDKPSEGTAILADFQEAGRGQTIGSNGMLGNKWQSLPGHNLLVSYILYPQFLAAQRQFHLNMAISLGVRDAVEHFTGHDEVKVKWPNDIYVRDRKICGILIENTLSGNTINSSIAGIGLNVNQREFSAGITNAVSLALVKDKDFAIPKVFEVLSAKLEAWYLQLKARKFDWLKSKYLGQLYQYNQNAWYTQNGERFVGKIVDVDEAGKLVLEVDGEERKFAFKEIIFE